MLCAFLLALANASINATRVYHGSAYNDATLESTNPFWVAASTQVAKMDIETGGIMLPIGSPAVLRHGPADKKELALTFDDGPHGHFTPKLLDLLDRYRVKATFFVIGKMAYKDPALLAEIARRGHLVANHTFSHANLRRQSLSDIETEYLAANNLIAAVTGQTPRFCRPPGGDRDGLTTRAAQLLGMTTVLWTADPLDYSNPGVDVLMARLRPKVANGGIILLHDGPVQTLPLLEILIPEMQAKGYTFVRLDKWI
ncbi:MAG: polysaccharide deacetylase family protein [Armatimonadetes bacterium]|nr:polysaccharide deacetylase family protein [Armatimonadota bacterium]